jgi:hypothetical protein
MEGGRACGCEEGIDRQVSEHEWNQRLVPIVPRQICRGQPPVCKCRSSKIGRDLARGGQRSRIKALRGRGNVNHLRRSVQILPDSAGSRESGVASRQSRGDSSGVGSRKRESATASRPSRDCRLPTADSRSKVAPQQDTHLWLFFEPSFSRSATVSGNGETRCTGPLAMSATVCPLRATAVTSAPLPTR